MADGIKVGDAYVEVTPNLDGFAAKLKAKVAAAVQQVTASRANEVDITPEVNTRAARAALSAFEKQLARLNGRDVDVDVGVRTGGAVAKLGALRGGLLGASLSAKLFNGAILAAIVGLPALSAAAIGAAGAVGALSSVMASAGAGFAAVAAVAGPSLGRIREALKAEEAAQKAAGAAASQAATQRIQAAAQAEAAAHRVADAQRALAGARRRAGELVETAQARLVDASRRLKDAQVDQRLAQEELTEARRGAKDALHDLREEVSDLALSEEGAEIRLIEARRRLNEVNNKSTASALDLRKARLDVAEAEDRLSDVRRDQRETTEKLQKAEKNGLVRTPQYESAMEGLARANEAVADAKRAHRKAQQDVAEAQVKGARLVADAARDLQRAERAQVRQQKLAAAQAGQTAAATRDLGLALAALSPLERKVMERFKKLRSAFEDWQKSLQPSVLPLFISGMDLLEQNLPKLTPIVKSAAGAFGDLLDSAKRALMGPFWTDFFKFLGNQAGPSIRKFGKVFGNVFTGVAGIIQAFGPTGQDLLDWMVKTSKNFKNWGKNLRKNPEFQEFIKTVKRIGPKVVEVLKQFGRAAGNLIMAFASSKEAQFMLDKLADFLRWVADNPHKAKNALYGIAGAFVAIKLALTVGGLVGKVRKLRTAVVGVGKKSDKTAGKVRGMNKAVRGIGPAVRAGIIGLLTIGAWKLLFPDDNSKKNIFETMVDDGKMFGRHIKWLAKQVKKYTWDMFVSWVETEKPWKRRTRKFFIQTLPGFVQATGRKISDLWGRLWGWVTRKFDRVIGGILRAIRKWAGRFLGRLRNLKDRIFRWAKSAGKWLLNTGKDIIQGLFKGIVKAMKGIGKWLKNHVWKPIVNGIKSLFGINSPSTVFAGFGFEMIRGLMKGLMKSNPGKVMSKVFGGASRLAEKALGWLVAKGHVAFRKIGNLAAGVRDRVVGFASGIAGFFKNVGGKISGFVGQVRHARNVAIVRSVAARRGWGSGAEWHALKALIMSESGFSNTAQNPTSTAYGMFQFLDSTWAGTGIRKTSNPLLQSIAGMRYIASRYGNPINAWAFKRAHNWYADGGLVTQPTHAIVGEAGPELILPLSRPDRMAELLGEAGVKAGDGGPLIGSLTVQTTPNASARDIIEETTFALRKLRRGGVSRYAH